MNIPQKQLDDSINGIVEYFNRTSKQANTEVVFKTIQRTSIGYLDGIYFLFLENEKITWQITQAKIDILTTYFSIPFEPQDQQAQQAIKPLIDPLPIADYEDFHDIECLDEHCLGECRKHQQDSSNKKLNKKSLKTGGACLPLAQSSEVVGQGGTIICTVCDGVGMDFLDMSPCDNCSGTGREYIFFPDHDTDCQCSSCQPYGPGLEPKFKLPTAVVI